MLTIIKNATNASPALVASTAIRYYDLRGVKVDNLGAVWARGFCRDGSMGTFKMGTCPVSIALADEWRALGLARIHAI